MHFLIAPVFEYGGNMIFVQAVRKIKPDFEYLDKRIYGELPSYCSGKSSGVCTGYPWIICTYNSGNNYRMPTGICILYNYGQKIDPIEAVELSWKLTRGHGWQIFFMGFVSIFIVIFGLLMLIVGIFPAIIWICSSFATLYESVLREKEKPAEVVTA